MLISFLTLILSFCIGILSGLFFRKRVPNFLGVVLACVIGVIGSVNTDWFIRQCIWLAVLAIFGVILSGKAFKNKPEK